MSGIKSLFEDQKRWIETKFDRFKDSVKSEVREEFEAALSQEREARILLENQVKELTIKVSNVDLEAVQRNRNFPALSRSWAPPSGKETDEREEKIKRTVVVGGFPQDTKRDSITTKMSEIIADAKGVQEKPYTLNKRATIGFVRFDSVESKSAFLQGIREKKDRPKYGPNSLFIGPERSTADRQKARPLTKIKNMLKDKGMEQEKIEIDFRMGAIWVDGEDQRIGEWEWNYSGHSTFKVNADAINRLHIDLSGEEVKAQVDKLCHRL